MFLSITIATVLSRRLKQARARIVERNLLKEVTKGHDLTYHHFNEENLVMMMSRKYLREIF